LSGLDFQTQKGETSMTSRVIEVVCWFSTAEGRDKLMVKFYDPEGDIARLVSRWSEATKNYESAARPLFFSAAFDIQVWYRPVLVYKALRIRILRKIKDKLKEKCLASIKRGLCRTQGTETPIQISNGRAYRPAQPAEISMFIWRMMEDQSIRTYVFPHSGKLDTDVPFIAYAHTP
jgi:hypothetical protein